MIINATHEDIQKALDLTNKEFDNNIEFNNFQRLSDTRHRVTLRVKESHGKGARLASYQSALYRKKDCDIFRMTEDDYQWGLKHRRHLINACWHVHGTFFDNLPVGTKINTRGNITYAGDQWEDFNIGSQMFPYYMSEACECE